MPRSNYTLLTIGDGLVAQIPALVISTAAGIIVSRVSTEEDIDRPDDRPASFSKPQALLHHRGILGLMGMIPGMPNFAFLLLAGGMVWLAWTNVQAAAGSRGMRRTCRPHRSPQVGSTGSAAGKTWRRSTRWGWKSATA